MPDGLTAFVTDSLVHLLSAFLMMRFFLPPSIKKRGWPLLACSGLFLVSGLIIETILAPWIHEGTLVFLLFFFVLLANRICKLPLVHSFCALFCHFCLMLGLGMVQSAHPVFLPERGEKTEQGEEDFDQLLEAGLLEEASATPTPTPQPEKTSSNEANEVISVLHDRMLHRKLVRSRSLLLDVMYPDDARAQPSPTPTPLPGDIPAAPTPVPGSIMEPEEFFRLFAPTPTPRPGGQVPPPLPTPTPVQGENVIHAGDAVAVNSNQLTNMVKLRNRSTDSMYMPPDFEIDAVGIGANGRYAIVNRVLMREGNIIRVESETVRGWRLVKIREGELFWQPLL